MAGTFFVISAPSGSGKTTLMAEVLKRLQGRYAIERLITYTTRKPGADEVDGVDYHFVSEQVFQERVGEGFFLEWSNTYTASYGTPCTVLDELQKGISYVGIVDRGGAKRIRMVCQQACLVWIYPPSLQELQARLVARSRESADEIARRIALAKIELNDEQKNRLYAYHVLNKHFDVAVREMEQIFCRYLSKYGARR